MRILVVVSRPPRKNTRVTRLLDQSRSMTLLIMNWLRFRLRSMLLFTAWFAFLFGSIKLWGVDDGVTYAWFVLVGYCALLPGSRWLGVAAVSCACVFTTTEVERSVYHYPIWQSLSGVDCVVVCTLLVTWLYLGFCAVRSRKPPNVQLGLLSFVVLLHRWSLDLLFVILEVALQNLGVIAASP